MQSVCKADRSFNLKGGDRWSSSEGVGGAGHGGLERELDDEG